MTTNHNILALDYGERRIGVAIASTEARLASSLMTIDREQFPDINGKLAELIKQHEVSVIVVGLPRGMEGQETAQTISARQFAQTLEAAFQVKIYMQDEAATSIEAEEELKAERKPYEKGDIDKRAAMIILSDWLANSEAMAGL